LDKTNKTKDKLADIASAFKEKQEGLYEPKPIAKNFQILPSGCEDHNPDASFRFQKYMSDKDGLKKEIKRLRKKMSGFLQNHAPALNFTRKTIEIKKFKYRLQTEQDKGNMANPLQGKGQWENIEIPHYGGPTGRATAFYRTTFEVKSSDFKSKTSWVCFSGVDYKCDVYLNNNYIGSHEGFFSPFEFDVSQYIKAGANTLTVKVDNDGIYEGNFLTGAISGDKLYGATGLGWNEPGVGWHHCPPGMGIWHNVKIEFRSSLHISDIFIQPDIVNKQIVANIEIENTKVLNEDFEILIHIFGQNFSKKIISSLKPNLKAGPGKNRYAFQIKIPGARLWEIDCPWLYQIQVKLNKDGKIIDAKQQHFGMRSFRLDTTTNPKGQFFLNNARIKLRGANTMGHEQQCVFKNDIDQLIEDVLIAKIANLNFYRLTQRPVSAEIYDICDKLGLLLQTDLPLFGVIRWNKFPEVLRQSEEMERLVRNHPSNIMVTFINEPYPNNMLDTVRHMGREEAMNLLKAASIVVNFANSDRVIKPVDGDYNPPSPGLPDNHCYTLWYNAHEIPMGKLNQGYWVPVKKGWNYACGEFGAEGLDFQKTMYKCYPKDWLPKEINSKWSPVKIPYSQTGKNAHMFFHSPQTIDVWIEKSHQWQAFATRFMTEAFRRDSRMVSFALHLLIDAFPAGWMKAVVDVDRNPKPAYFEFKHALEPLACNIQTDRFTYFSGDKTNINLWICNDTNEVYNNLKIKYQILKDSEVIFASCKNAIVESVEPVYQGTLRYKLPRVYERTQFSLEMAIINESGGIIHNSRKCFEVFPKSTLPAASNVYTHKIKNSTLSILKDTGIAHQKWTKGAKGIILADSIDNLEVLYKDIERGATLLLTEFTSAPDQNIYKVCFNEYKTETYNFKLGKYAFSIEPLGWFDRYYVDCKTGHQLVEELQENDFRFWYNSETHRIEPIARYCINTKIPADKIILHAGQGNWEGRTSVQLKPVVAEYIIGKGRLVVSTLALKGFVKTNPIAKLFLQRLITYCNFGFVF
jgi:hypothetical protein